MPHVRCHQRPLLMATRPKGAVSTRVFAGPASAPSPCHAASSSPCSRQPLPGIPRFACSPSRSLRHHQGLPHAGSHLEIPLSSFGRCVLHTRRPCCDQPDSRFPLELGSLQTGHTSFNKMCMRLTRRNWTMVHNCNSRPLNSTHIEGHQ